jgi:hypothetical protein
MGDLAQPKTAPSRFKNSQIIFSANHERRRGSERQQGRNAATLNRNHATENPTAHTNHRNAPNRLARGKSQGRRARNARAASRWRASSMRHFNSEARFGQSANEGAGRPAPAALAQLK